MRSAAPSAASRRADVSRGIFQRRLYRVPAIEDDSAGGGGARGLRARLAPARALYRESWFTPHERRRSERMKRS